MVVRAVAQSEKRAMRAIAKKFKRLAKDLSDRIRSEEKGLGEDIQKMIDNAFEGIVADVTKNAKKTIRIGQRVMKADLNVDVDWNLLNENAVRYLQSLETLHLSNRD